jgi:hypothetical protein
MTSPLLDKALVATVLLLAATAANAQPSTATIRPQLRNKPPKNEFS